MGALFSYKDDIASSDNKERNVDNLLFRLPKAITDQILSQWLDIFDVGRLDSAMTNMKQRPDFLLCLKEMRNPTVPVYFRGMYNTPSWNEVTDQSRLRWISKRLIHVKEISLRFFHDNEEFIESLQLPSLQKLSVLGSRWLRHIPQICPLVEELSVRDINSSADVEDLTFVCSHCLKLESISIGSLLFQSSDCTDDVLAALQAFGHLIVKISSASGGVSYVTTEGFKSFVKCCPRLQKFHYTRFKDNGTILMCVAQTCPLIEEILFDTSSKKALLELSQKCKKLRKVETFEAISIAEMEVLGHDC